MKYRFAAFAATLLLGAVMIPSAGFAENELNPGSSQDTHPKGRGNRNRETPSPGKSTGSGGAVVTGNGISYHGGAVMHGTVNVYYIWYGDWTKDPGANQILTNWGNSIGGSPYENINTTYGDTTGNVSGAIALSVKSTSMASSTFGTSLSDSSIASIVSKALSTGALPTDSNGVYFVLTAPYIAETSGFLTQYCGWHTYGNINGANIKYAFVGNAAAGLGSCAIQTGSSPNNDPAADAMVSVMSHELEESASDPNLNAWYDSNGEEDADKCAWTFGSTYGSTGGSIANMNLGGHDYLIQQNWVNAGGGYCALSYASTPDFSLAVSPTSQTLPSTGGTTGNYSISEAPTGGFTGTVTYAVSGLPSGATASAVSSSNTFTVTAAGVSSGTYPFTIMGTSGSLVHSITANLVISQPAAPTFTVSVSPASQSVSRGGKVTFTVTIAPVSGFTGTVGLTVSGAKTGLTPSLSTTSIVASGTSTLTAVTTNSAKRGNNTLTITATYAGPGTPITKFAATTLKIN